MIASNHRPRQHDFVGSLSIAHHQHHPEQRSNILPSMPLRSSPQKRRRWRYYRQLTPDAEDEKEDEIENQDLEVQVFQQLIQPQERRRNRQHQQPSSDLVGSSGSPSRRRGLLKHGSKRLILSLWSKSNGTPTRPSTGGGSSSRSPFSLVRRRRQHSLSTAENLAEKEGSSDSILPPPPPPLPPPQIQSSVSSMAGHKHPFSSSGASFYEKDQLIFGEPFFPFANELEGAHWSPYPVEKETQSQPKTVPPSIKPPSQTARTRSMRVSQPKKEITNKSGGDGDGRSDVSSIFMMKQPSNEANSGTTSRRAPNTSITPTTSNESVSSGSEDDEIGDLGQYNNYRAQLGRGGGRSRGRFTARRNQGKHGQPRLKKSDLQRMLPLFQHSKDDGSDCASSSVVRSTSSATGLSMYSILVRGQQQQQEQQQRKKKERRQYEEQEERGPELDDPVGHDEVEIVYKDITPKDINIISEALNDNVVNNAATASAESTETAAQNKNDKTPPAWLELMNGEIKEKLKSLTATATTTSADRRAAGMPFANNICNSKGTDFLFPTSSCTPSRSGRKQKLQNKAYEMLRHKRSSKHQTHVKDTSSTRVPTSFNYAVYVDDDRCYLTQHQTQKQQLQPDPVVSAYLQQVMQSRRDKLKQQQQVVPDDEESPSAEQHHEEQVKNIDAGIRNSGDNNESSNAAAKSAEISKKKKVNASPRSVAIDFQNYEEQDDESDSSDEDFKFLTKALATEFEDHVQHEVAEPETVEDDIQEQFVKPESVEDQVEEQVAKPESIEDHVQKEVAKANAESASGKGTIPDSEGNMSLCYSDSDSEKNQSSSVAIKDTRMPNNDAKISSRIGDSDKDSSSKYTTQDVSLSKADVTPSTTVSVGGNDLSSDGDSNNNWLLSASESLRRSRKPPAAKQQTTPKKTRWINAAESATVDCAHLPRVHDGLDQGKDDCDIRGNANESTPDMTLDEDQRDETKNDDAPSDEERSSYSQDETELSLYLDRVTLSDGVLCKQMIDRFLSHKHTLQVVRVVRSLRLDHQSGKGGDDNTVLDTSLNDSCDVDTIISSSSTITTTTSNKTKRLTLKQQMELCEIVNALCTLPKLIKLSLVNLEPQDLFDASTLLVQHPTLRSFELRLSAGTVDDMAVHALATIPNLESVTFRVHEACNIGGFVCSKSLKELCVACPSLSRRSHKPSIPFRTEHITDMIQGLGLNVVCLHSLDLEPRLSTSDFRLLIRMLTTNGTLRSVYFSWMDNIPEASGCIEEVADMLEANKTLHAMSNYLAPFVSVDRRHQNLLLKALDKNRSLTEFNVFDKTYLYGLGLDMIFARNSSIERLQWQCKVDEKNIDSRNCNIVDAAVMPASPSCDILSNIAFQLKMDEKKTCTSPIKAKSSS